MIENSNKTENFYDAIAPKYDSWKQKNSYYHQQLQHLYKFLIPPNKKIIEIGCSTGDLLASVKPGKGVGIDISNEMLKIARKKYPKYIFIKSSAEQLELKEKFDYIILSDLIGILDDIHLTLQKLHTISSLDTRIIINCHNYFWESILSFAARLGLKTPQPTQSWLSHKDIENLLTLADFDIVKENAYLLIPFYIPFVSFFVNKYIARLPIIRNIFFVRFFVARIQPPVTSDREYSISVVLPARNEEGNIETAVREISKIGKKTEIIFVEDHSTDNTQSEIKRVMEKYKNKRDNLIIASCR